MQTKVICMYVGETKPFAPHLQKNNQLKVPVNESNASENKCSAAAFGGNGRSLHRNTKAPFKSSFYRLCDSVTATIQMRNVWMLLTIVLLLTKIEALCVNQSRHNWNTTVRGRWIFWQEYQSTPY